MLRLPILAIVLAACHTPEVVPDAPPEVAYVNVVNPELMPPEPVAEPVTAEPAAVPDVAETPVATYATYTLRRGESLAHFARWSELPVETIAEASGLDLAGSYPVGTTVRVPVATPEQQARIEEYREQHRSDRVDGYLASRGGAVGTGFVEVHSGDTAWSIARDNQDIPVWMLEAYNPSTDLDHLRPGDELMVPVLADVVVDAQPDAIVAQ
jgi:hypothetical protein